MCIGGLPTHAPGHYERSGGASKARDVGETRTLGMVGTAESPSEREGGSRRQCNHMPAYYIVSA
jgi:hypothetical protein